MDLTPFLLMTLSIGLWSIYILSSDHIEEKLGAATARDRIEGIIIMMYSNWHHQS